MNTCAPIEWSFKLLGIRRYKLPLVMMVAMNNIQSFELHLVNQQLCKYNSSGHSKKTADHYLIGTKGPFESCIYSKIKEDVGISC